jgi:hypothetical protein
MDTVSRDVRDLPEAERSALERLIGHELRDAQRVIVQVIDASDPVPDETRGDAAAGVPAWWKVYEGLSDEEVDRLDEAVRLRADLTRTFA